MNLNKRIGAARALALACASVLSVHAQSQDYRAFQSAPSVAIYLNPDTPGLNKTVSGTWDYRPSGNACIDDHFWTNLNDKLGLGSFRNAQTTGRLVNAVTATIQHTVRFSSVADLRVGPYGSMRQCVLYLVPSTFTQRSQGAGYGKYVLQSNLILIGQIPLAQLSASVTAADGPKPPEPQPAQRTVNQRELPPGVSYEFYNLQGREHDGRLYTPVLKVANWNDAKRFCETLQFAGVTGWHLPDAEELQKFARDIGEHEMLYDPHPYADGTNMPSNYWTSQSYPSDPGWHSVRANRLRGKFLDGRLKKDTEFAGVVCAR